MSFGASGCALAFNLLQDASPLRLGEVIDARRSAGGSACNIHRSMLSSLPMASERCPGVSGQIKQDAPKASSRLSDVVDVRNPSRWVGMQASIVEFARL